MRFQQYLLEKKDHIIKRLKNLSQEEKDQLIPLFQQNNPKLEGMIDWNNKNLTFNDFKPVLNYQSKSGLKKKVKKQGIKGLKPNKDYIELKNISDVYNAYIPLTYEASKLIASKAIGGCTGRWCTAYQKTSSYWSDYVVARGITLIYLIGNDTKYAAAVYPETYIELFDADDLSISHIPDFDHYKLKSGKLLNLYKEIQKKYFKIPSFVDKAKVTDVEYEVKNNGNYVIWHDGRWVSGTWEDGEWHNGLFKGGTWEGGTWLDGVWQNGVWNLGTWENGQWQNGTWKYGIWKNGEWENGVWKGGIWHDGTWEGGTWNTGTWLDGTWGDGVWKNGTWESGAWYDGTFEDGTFQGGTWNDGTFEGGIWNGGQWRQGKWKGGKWILGTDRYGALHFEGDSPDLWD